MEDSLNDKALTLELVEQQFEHWRETKTRREPIPETLWEAAADLCRRHPITHVCRRLRLSFRDLKRRVSKEKSTPVKFMELDLSCLSAPWQIECERPDGAKLRFSGSGQPPAIDPLLARFLS